MDPTKILEADHRAMEDLIAQIKEAKGAERKQLIDELAHYLEAHMTLEEEVMYPHMKKVTGAEPIHEGKNEHDLARSELQDLLDLKDEPGIGAAIDALEAGLKHHTDEEEEDLFPELRERDGGKVLDEMERPFIAKRRELQLDVPAKSG